MPSLRELFLGILLPALICGSVLALAWARRGGERDARGRAVPFIGALALGLGYLCSNLAFLGSIAVPSSTRTLAARDWLAWIAIAAVVVYAVLPVNRTLRVRALADASLAALCVWLCRGNTLDKPNGWGMVALLAALAIGAVLSTQSLTRRATGLQSATVLFFVAFATSIASLVSRSALIALLAGGLCACFGACAVIAMWNPRFTMHGGATAVGVLLLVGLWINSVLFSRMPQSAGLCLCASLLTPWIVVRGGATRGRWTELASIAVVVLVPAIAAVLIAQRAAPEPYY